MARGYGIGNYDTSIYGQTNYIDAAPTVTSSSTVTASAVADYIGAATIASTSTLAIDPQAKLAGVTLCSATSSVSAAGQRIGLVYPIVQSASVLVTHSEKIHQSGAAVSGESSVAIEYIRIRKVAASLAGTSTATTTANVIYDGTPDALSSSSSATATGQLIAQPKYDTISSTTSLSANGQGTFGGGKIVDIASISAVSLDAHITASSGVRLISGESQVSASGRLKWEYQADIADTWSDVDEVTDTWTVPTDITDSWTQLSSPWR